MGGTKLHYIAYGMGKLSLSNHGFAPYCMTIHTK